MKADDCDTADVVIERALTLTPQDNLLLKRFVNIVEAINTQDGFFNDSRLSSFFSSC
jgi:hypothetical protein